MRRLIYRSLLGSTSILAFATVAFAQSVLLQQGEVVAATGDTVPGTVLGETFGGSSTFDTGVMDDSGKILFRGRLTGGGVSAADERALFYGSSRSNLQMVVRGGDAEPSGTLPGVTLNTSSGTQGLGSSYRISKDGRMMWSSSLFGAGVTTTNDTAVYVGVPGNFQIFVREGDLAPFGGATITSSFSSISQQNTSLNSSGVGLIKVTLAGGDVVGTTNNEAWLYGTPGNLTMLARKGDIAPGGEVLAGVSPGFVSQMNEAGQVMFDVSFVAGTGTNPVTTANDRALWLYTPGLGNVQLIREGDASPIPGVSYGTPSNSWSINTGSTTFNASGEVLLRVDLAGAVVAGVDDMAIVKVSTAGHSIVVRRGEAVAALPGVSFGPFNNSSLQLAANGRVAFECSLVGTSGTTDDTAIFSGTPGDWALVVREGDLVTNMPNFVFGNVNGVSIVQNNAGQLLFANTITDTVDFFNSYFGWTAGLGLQQIGTAADIIETSPGSQHQYGSSGGIQFGNGAGRPLTFRDNGDFVHRVNFQDGTAAQMTGHVGSFVGVPAEISASAGGTHNMYLNGGGAQAGNTYFVLGSVTGTNPGFPAGGFTCPLNLDVYTNITIQFANTPFLNNTFSLLDLEGRNNAALLIPPAIPGLAGLTMHHAFLAFNPFGAIKFASEADGLTFTP